MTDDDTPAWPTDVIDRTKYATYLEDKEGFEYWVSGRILGDEMVVPEGRRPFPEQDRRYEKVEEIKLGKRKRDADEAVFDAIEAIEETNE